MKIADRLAFTTLGCPDWSLETSVRRGADMGYGAIEIRGIGAQMRTGLLEAFLPRNRQATRALLERHGVRICGIGTSAAFHDAQRVPEAIEEGREALEICKAMDVPAIRVFGNQFVPGEEREVTIRRVAQGLGELCDIAAGLGGARVLLEIHGEFNRCEALEALLSRVGDHPYFGILWDIEHSYRAYGNDFGAFYRLIRPHIRHVHVKDCVIRGDQLEIKLPGAGEMDIPAMIRALEADGYAGWYSFEWEKRWHPEIPGPEIAFPAYVDYMRGISPG